MISCVCGLTRCEYKIFSLRVNGPRPSLSRTDNKFTLSLEYGGTRPEDEEKIEEEDEDEDEEDLLRRRAWLQMKGKIERLRD